MVERRNLLRRGFHLLTSLFVVYYWLPLFIPELGLYRWQVALLGLALLGSFEAYRIHQGWLFFGLRDYEKRAVAGYFWGASGYVLALLLFPQALAMITILGTAFTDPVLGEMRRRPAPQRWGPAAGFAVWCAVATATALAVPLAIHWWVVPLGAAVAVAAESARVKHVDDNFVMNIVPLVVLTAVTAVTGL
jgi:hypothetical protein